MVSSEVMLERSRRINGSFNSEIAQMQQACSSFANSIRTTPERLRSSGRSSSRPFSAAKGTTPSKTPTRGIRGPSGVTPSKTPLAMEVTTGFDEFGSVTPLKRTFFQQTPLPLESPFASPNTPVATPSPKQFRMTRARPFAECRVAFGAAEACSGKSKKATEDLQYIHNALLTLVSESGCKDTLRKLSGSVDAKISEIGRAHV